MPRRLWALGDVEAAGRALQASIDAARARGADYEFALSTDGLVRMPELRAYFDDADALIAEGQAVFDRLGVVIVTL